MTTMYLCRTGNKDMKNINKQATEFLETIHGPALKLNTENQIQIGSFEPSTVNGNVNTIEEAVNMTFELCNQGRDVYYGVNSYAGGGCTKNDVSYVNTFHVEVDFGTVGHKKVSKYATKEDALKAINNFAIKPTIIVLSGGGFHVYWVLNKPIKVDSNNLTKTENINKFLSEKVGGDPGTQDISRVLRVPGTLNFKDKKNPRKVRLIVNNNIKYAIEDFEQLISEDEPTPEPSKKPPTNDYSECPISLKDLNVRPGIKKLIKNGNQGEYESRSEADMAVIYQLCRAGLSENEIKYIYKNTDYMIGEKYREQANSDQYFKITIEKAKKRISELLNLTEEENNNPLFVKGILYKENDRIKLNIVRLQEYITRKYKLCRFSQVFFLYEGKCYVECNEEEINKKCQDVMDDYRYLFKPKELKEFNHFAIGNTTIKKEDGVREQSRYLTLQNGLFDLKEEKLIPHTPEIFTNNLMDYKYDPEAKCTRFLQYLDEVFLGNTETINFVQQAVGYIFHKRIPTAAIFFLIGGGSNGKSVFIILLYSLFGEHNTCKLSLTKFSDERYIPQLFGKMLNVSAETPQKKQINTDSVKEIVSGDIVTGRAIYSHPISFHPYAKHFLSMNEEPVIDDTSHGMWRRVYPIEFLREFSKEEQDVFLIDKLKSELPGIFNWALEGYKILKENKFKLTETPMMNDKKQQIKELGNNVLKFESEKLKKSTGTDTRLSEIFKSYENYCTSEGEKHHKNKGEFKAILKSAGWKFGNSTKHSNNVCIFNAKVI